MKLAELLPALEQVTITGDTARDIRALRYDSRLVERDDIFFAWRGEKTDGHQYIPGATERGASAVVLENSAFAGSRGVTYLEVPDARRALARMAAAYHGHPSRRLRMVGITGTNGKTTTSFLLKHLLEKAGRRTGLIGTVRYEIGDRITPATRTTPEGSDLQELLSRMWGAGCGGVVMEVSSHALQQGRVEGTDFHTAVFTNLTPDHLDYHGTMESYRAAKGQLFDRLTPGTGVATAVLNVDDAAAPWFRSRLDPSVRVVTFSADGRPADWMARGIQTDVGGTRFELFVEDQRWEVELPLLGQFNVANALAAAAAARGEGLELGAIVEGLRDAPSVPGRMERVTTVPYTVVVDYAHTEDALVKILSTLRGLSPRKLILVVGCGGNRDREKRPHMAAAACAGADHVIFTADNPRNEPVEEILREMETGVGHRTNWQHCPDRREAIAQALAVAGAGDVVCIAGKGHETTQEINGIYHPFDDREIVRHLLGLGGGN